MTWLLKQGKQDIHPLWSQWRWDQEGFQTCCGSKDSQLHVQEFCELLLNASQQGSRII